MGPPAFRSLRGREKGDFSARLREHPDNYRVMHRARGTRDQLDWNERRFESPARLLLYFATPSPRKSEGERERGGGAFNFPPRANVALL